MTTILLTTFTLQTKYKIQNVDVNITPGLITDRRTQLTSRH